jgi:hypothetical protein
MLLRAALALTLLAPAWAQAPAGAEQTSTPAPPTVACRRAGLAEHPLRDSQGAAQFYYGLPLELLDAEQRSFLGHLFKGGAGCSLTAGPAKLGGQAGTLVTLAYADGVSLQAFCQGSGFKSCLVRSRQSSDQPPAAGSASPWVPGALQVIKSDKGANGTPATLETVEIELVSGASERPGGRKLQQLGSFRAPAQLLQGQQVGP